MIIRCKIEVQFNLSLLMPEKYEKGSMKLKDRISDPDVSRDLIL